MKMQLGRNGSARTLRSRLGTALGLGSAAALVIAGVALVGVLPASAAASDFSFTSLPASVAANTALPSFTVTYQPAMVRRTRSRLSSTNCTLTPSGNLTGYDCRTSGNAHSLAHFGGASTGTSCTMTATDTPTGGTRLTCHHDGNSRRGEQTRLYYRAYPPRRRWSRSDTFKVSS